MHRSASTREGRLRGSLRSRVVGLLSALALLGSTALVVAPAASAVELPFQVQAPANGSTVDTASPVYSGSGTTGNTVTVIYSGQNLLNYTAGTATVDDAGSWSTGPTDFTSANPGETENRTRVTERTPDGTVVDETFVTITFATAPVPAAGQFRLDSPTEGEERSDLLNIVNFLGVGDPGNLIVVRYFDGRGGLAEAGRGEVDSDGTFNVLTTYRDLPAGQDFVNTFTAQFTPDGDSVAREIGRNFTFAVAPVELDPFLVVSPENGARVDTLTPAFTGTGAAGDTVNLTYGGQGLGTYVAGTTTVDENGDWVIPVTDFSNANFGETEIRVLAEATSPTGVVRPGGTFVTIVLPTAPAPVTVFTLDTPEEGDLIPNPRTGVPFIGTGEPGNTIVVEFFNGRGGLSVAGEAVVEDDGTFQVDAFFTDLPVDQDFANTFTQQENADGERVAAEIGRTIFFGLAPVVAPLAPPTLDQPVVDGTTVTFSGTGVAGATVQVNAVDSVPPTADGPEPAPAQTLTATVGEDGTWSVSGTFVAATYIASATQFTTDGADRSAPTEGRTFTVAAVVAPPGGGTPDPTPVPTPDPAPAPTPAPTPGTPGAPGGSGGSGSLPATGADAGATLLALAAMLLAGGTATLVVRRVRAAAPR